MSSSSYIKTDRPCSICIADFDNPPYGEQIQDPNNGFQVHERGVSSGDHSFEAHADGKYIYCFSNEHSPAATKEVSFNVHGIVYVPESEVSSDPLETEGVLRPLILLPAGLKLRRP